MTIKKVDTSSRFERSFSRLPLSVQQAAVERKAVFRDSPFAPTLRTHKLSGKLRGLWSFPVTHSHRIVFEFLNDETALFHDIGDHSIYR